MFSVQTCQTSSWRHAHKFICPIYKRNYPKILPTTARAILEILIRRSKGLLLDAEWEDLKALQSHADDFKQQQEIEPEGMTTWQTVEIMSQAIKTYSGTDEPIPVIQDINAMVSAGLTARSCSCIRSLVTNGARTDL